MRMAACDSPGVWPMTTMTPELLPGARFSTRLDSCVDRARTAAVAFRRLDQEEVDRIVRAMVVAGLEHAIELAELAVLETGFGVVEDKVIKNLMATETLYDYLDGKRTVGVICEDARRATQEVAEPIGVVLALLPITNPTSTALFKAIVAAKTRNAMIVRPAARAARCSQRAIEIVRAAGEAAGLPVDALQVVPDPTREASRYLFEHPGVNLIWTTGGQKAVRAASEAGKPCIGVGSGNAPVYVHRSADVRMAALDILVSKTFDASVICAAEQTLVIDEAIYDELVAELERMGARMLSHEECDALVEFALEPEEGGRADALGQSCANLSARSGFARDDEATKVLLARLPAYLDELARHPLVGEKPMPVLGIVRSSSVEHAIAACQLVTEQGGLGHTSAVYAQDEDIIACFAEAMRTSRILVNTPAAMGALGGVYNALTPTLSLGCGTWGGSNTTANVNYKELLNVKTVARRQAPPQCFGIPSTTYFNTGAIESLRELSAAQVLIVTDAATQAGGAVDDVLGHLAAGVVHVCCDVAACPTQAQVHAGALTLAATGADLVVAVGGGSVIDAAKAMRLLFEHPELNLGEFALPFLDARKRVAGIPPPPDRRVRLVAVPTTGGTGAEISPTAVISVGGRHVTLDDRSLAPDMAIVEPRLTLTMVPALTADAGVDALTHALEAYVSIFASPFTDAFCLQAIRLILDALPRAFADGSDLAARTDMANAATIAGLARSGALLGVNHGLAHALGAHFGIAHGCANGLFLPHVLRYNAQIPSKFTPAPGYSAYVAPEKYAQIARMLGLGGHTEQRARERLFEHVDELLTAVGMPRTVFDLGLPAIEYAAARDELAMAAFRDSSLRANPRMPLVAELRELLEGVA
jgi:acetaldehyde dehydrogenase/alcohol dehydrogenase